MTSALKKTTRALLALSMGGFLAACACKKPEETIAIADTTAVVPVLDMPVLIAPVNLQEKLKTAAGDKVFFAFNSSALSQQSKDTLDKQARFLSENESAKVQIIIEGHGDERGTADVNFAIGGHRADAVKNYLVHKGVSAARISTISYGKERPEATGHTAHDHAINRRAITIVQGG